MANIQVTHDSDINNARSESALVVNPKNPLQIVSSSKKFSNIHTYDFTLATPAFLHEGPALSAPCVGTGTSGRIA